MVKPLIIHQCRDFVATKNKNALNLDNSLRQTHSFTDLFLQSRNVVFEITQNLATCN